MSLQFIMGNSGSGKSYCLYDTVVREASAELRAVYVITIYYGKFRKRKILQFIKKGCSGSD